MSTDCPGPSNCSDGRYQTHALFNTHFCCCQINKSHARWQKMPTLPSLYCGSSQRVATATSVGVSSPAQRSCETLYRRKLRSGSARKPSSYWGMTSNPVRTPHTPFRPPLATVDRTALFPSASRISTLGTSGLPTLWSRMSLSLNI